MGILRSEIPEHDHWLHFLLKKERTPVDSGHAQAPQSAESQKKGVLEPTPSELCRSAVEAEKFNIG